MIPPTQLYISRYEIVFDKMLAYVLLASTLYKFEQENSVQSNPLMHSYRLLD